ncbi:MAG: succinate-semialdehyde dehydrogenase / glutarate-semialdehyde dehydrogenase [Pseudomonadota bacterium]|nr:succinate-semialdehyde dehydrogenase / glutarate-semialdehyde dehydrogenase [Pseudomonadota bacterium]
MGAAVKMQENLFTDLFINSKWVKTNKQYVVTNPATGQQIASVSHAGSDEIEAAIQSATVAFKVWKNSSAKTRCEKLQKWCQLIIAHKEQLAALITMECGKPLKEAANEALYAASFVEWAAEQARRIDGVIIDSHMPNTEINVAYEPVGVVAAITPWNFPVAMVTRKIAPAIAAGCSIVLKPSELTPLSALYLAHLALLAEFPEGLINIIGGDSAEIGAKFTHDERIRKITFTGSTRVGKILLADSASTLKRVSLELGGNAPFIIFEDADMDEALAGLMQCKFRNAGQTCVCANRILVQQSIYDEFAARFKNMVAKLNVGNGFDENTNIGPLINLSGKQKAQAHIKDAVNKGATLYFGGEDLGGNFLQPTILTHVTDDALLCREETFGPVAPIFSFIDEDEAVYKANNTKFGLAAYFFTSDYKRIHRLKRSLEVGMIGVNSGVLSAENVPFGGVKESGLGREGGKPGIYEFVEAKYTMNKF